MDPSLAGGQSGPLSSGKCCICKSGCALKVQMQIASTLGARKKYRQKGSTSWYNVMGLTSQINSNCKDYEM